MDVRFPLGGTHLIVGPSGSGKTHRIASLLRLKNELIKGGGDIKNVVFFYNSWQSLYEELEKENIVTKWINHLPSNEEFIDHVQPFNNNGGSIVVIDDFMTDINKDLVEIVTVSSRHNNTSTFILFQGLFPPSPLGRQISLNAKHMHIHKNPRENAQFTFLARQMDPIDWKWIVEAYHEATKKPYSCFVINLNQDCPEHLKFLSDIIPSEWPMRAWVSKKRRN